MGAKDKESKGIKYKYLKWLMPFDWIIRRFGYMLYGSVNQKEIKSGQGIKDSFTYYIITIKKNGSKR